MNPVTSTFLRTLVAGAILSALSFTTEASAEEGATPPQMIVKFADLDVSTPQGAAALYGRIHGAADDICWRMYHGAAAYRWRKNACLRQRIADAVIRVNSPALSAVFASRYGLSPPVVLAAAGVR